MIHKFKVLLLSLVVFASVVSVSATTVENTELHSKQTYYSVDWDGENNKVIGTTDEVYIDAYYSFDVSKIVDSEYTIDEIMAEVNGSGEASIAADSFFVSWGNAYNTLHVTAESAMSTKNTLVIKVSHGTSSRGALRYLGNGAAYSIQGSAEFTKDDTTYTLSLDEAFVINETKAVTHKNDYTKSIYVTGYTLPNKEITKNAPFTIGVQVVDPNFLYSTMSGKTFDKSLAILTGEAFGSSNKQGYISDVRNDPMGYLMYTVWFEDIRYLEEGPLEFSVSYMFQYTQNGQSFYADQTKEASTVIYELKQSSDASFVPNVMITNYTGQNGLVAGTNLELKVDFKNTNKTIDVHNIVVTVDGGNTFQQTKGVNKFYIDSIPSQETSTITLYITCPKTLTPGSYPIDFDIEYQYIHDGETQSQSTNGKISIPVIQVDRLQVNYVKMSNVYQNSEGEVNYSIINTGMSTLLNANLQILDENEEVLGTLFLGRLEPSKEAKGSNIYIVFPEAGEKELTARITYEDDNFNQKVLEEKFMVSVIPNEIWIDEPIYEDPIIVEPAESDSNSMLWIGGLVVVVVGALGVVVYKKKKNKGVIDDEDL
ncbi:MAG: hypothetical protein E7191_02170 [Erysipelotrichaceae bacterium]|nr:hypothetical protein [Erysipelotrichaceae bacterium]